MWKVGVIFIIAFTLTHVSSGPSKAVIAPSLQKTIESKGKVDIVISLRQKTSPVLNSIKSRSFATRGARLNAVASVLQTHAKQSQESVSKFLATKNVEFRSFWISNKISIKAADSELIKALATFAEVERIREDRITSAPILEPIPSSANGRSREDVEWSVARMEAPEAWAQGYTGQGVVVGIIDSGVRATHSRLAANFRRERGWLDTTEGLEDPYDLINHGTIIAGCLLGSGGIGVAPDAQFIACGSQFGNNYISDLHRCAEFMICPTHPNGTEPDCEAAPHIVNNSWGVIPDGTVEDFFDEALDAWEAAGLISVFSVGNTGSDCETAIYPANTGRNIFSVGATDAAEELAYFSSRGPGWVNGALSPNIVAPGVDIASSSHEDDEAMVFGSRGTSESAPFVSGVIALLLSNGTELSYEQVSSYVFESASQTVVPSGGNCGGILETEYPNHGAGYGRITAAGALAKMLENRK